jgi:hypothetical protein
MQQLWLPPTAAAGIVLRDLPPAHVGNARLWDCMLQGMLQAKAQLLAESLGMIA